MNSTYPILEVFDSVQGEGLHTGLGATFIRLAGCNLRCTWCDTAHSIARDGGELLSVEALLARHAFGQPLVIITGGEPTLHELGPLVQALHALGKYVCLETNGTNPVPEAWGIDWITASPKPQSGYAVRCRANELKYVVDEGFSLDVIDFEKAPGNIILQVESGKPASVAKAYALVMANPQHKLRLGVQLHKLIGVE